MPHFLGHDRGESGEVVPVSPSKMISHVFRGVFRVGQHGQEMSAVEGGGVVVADSGIGGEKERVCEVYAAVVVADDILAFPVDCLERLVFQNTVELGVENKLADEPTSFWGEGFKVGVFSGE